jgi:hypothetical protein
MAKFKPVGSGTKKKVEPASTRGLIPCSILIVLALGMLFGLMFFALKSTK